MKTKDLLKEPGKPYKKAAGPCITGISCRLWRAIFLCPMLILTLNLFLTLSESNFQTRSKAFHHLIHIRLFNHQRRNKTDNISPGAD